MKIVGITACPTGIAHTYMAQESLENECRSRGYEVKIETQGSIGIENELTEEDIRSADVAILAVSIMIEGEERFEDIPVLRVSVDRAISDVKKLVDEAVALAAKGA